MTRFALMIALALSVALHAWLLRSPDAGQAQAAAIPVIPIIETELAQRETAEEEPKPAPEPEPVPEPEPKPAPQEQPQPEPQPPPPPEPEPEPQPEPRQQEPQPEPAPAPPPPEVRPPLPNLVKVAEPEAAPEAPAAEAPAAVSTPRSEGRRQPVLRIDWGSVERARAVVDAGMMKIVVLDERSGAADIRQEVARSGETWARGAYQPPPNRMYSNRLRIVDDVPAFSAARSAARLGPGERLAVVLPVEVDRLLESAQAGAAFAIGVPLEEIRGFAGHFTLLGNTLDFKITHVGQARERSGSS